MPLSRPDTPWQLGIGRAAVTTEIHDNNTVPALAGLIIAEGFKPQAYFPLDNRENSIQGEVN
jgi:hypothetical protein